MRLDAMWEGSGVAGQEGAQPAWGMHQGAGRTGCRGAVGLWEDAPHPATLVGRGVPRPERGTASRMGTHRGQTSCIARSPSGVKLMAVMDNFIPSFIFRNTEQLETAAVTYHTPANCSRTSPVGFGKATGTCHLPAGPATHHVGPATLCGDQPA